MNIEIYQVAAFTNETLSEDLMLSIASEMDV